MPTNDAPRSLAVLEEEATLLANDIYCAGIDGGSMRHRLESSKQERDDLTQNILSLLREAAGQAAPTEAEEPLEWLPCGCADTECETYRICIPINLPDNRPLTLYAVYGPMKSGLCGCLGLKFTESNEVCFQQDRISNADPDALRADLERRLALLRRALGAGMP